MNIHRILLFILAMLLLISLSEAATLKGAIYDSNLEQEKDILVQINTTPPQQYLAKDGTYLFEIPPGSYVLTARNDAILIQEHLEIREEGTFIFDLFMLPSLEEEEQLWQDTQTNTIQELEETNYSLWPYFAAALLFAAGIVRIIYYRKKYGSVSFFRKKIKQESEKSIEQARAELDSEPAYFDQALTIIRKNDGRITQKELRSEMNYLSEAKVSLIVAELEHRGKIEKIKKGRGNLIFLKDHEAKKE